MPVLQYNQFHSFDRVVSDPAVQKMAAQRWFDLADERNRWGRDVFDALVAEATAYGALRRLPPGWKPSWKVRSLA